ncbi:MAG: ABC transporter substrate-binding protein [Bacteroidales bacterium]|nr:ABC transporter substrate-binding protein [Bacteroidales bacterium]
MKKIFLALAAVMMTLACTEDRSQILKVYNWADYIDEELIGEFEAWYEEQTGEKVTVVYQTFDINETMLSKIELGHEDYDLACPSDYIIERMLSNDLLIPIDKDFGDTPNYIDNVSPYIVEELFNQIEGNGKNANDYSVGYMWGTTGLLYNREFVSDEEVKTWDVLRKPEYAGKILIKDAFRDVYTSLLISFNMDAIERGEKNIQTIGFDASEESIAKVEEYLRSFKDGVAGWEADFGKDQMTKGLAWINLSWSGDAQWAMDEAAEVGVDLNYSIPYSGSTVWFDGWVIPKYARNIKAASYFINFLCMPENVVRNMDAIGYVSAIGGQEVLEAMIDEESFEPIDVSYFFGEEADSVCVNPVLYPDRKVMERCGMMHDVGTEDLLKMWSRIKGDSASAWTYILICLVLGGLIAAVIIKYAKKRYRRRRYAKKRRR